MDTEKVLETNYLKQEPENIPQSSSAKRTKQTVSGHIHSTKNRNKNVTKSNHG